jgi:DNA-binding response OmpR family regulator
MNILLFDEEPILRKATASMLAARGGKVTTARDLAELFALTSKRIYDVLVIDVAASGPSATSLLDRIRSSGLVPRRVIVCTESALTRIEAGAFTQVLLKPFPFEALIHAVFGAANRRRPTRSGVFARVRLDVPRSRPRRAAPPGGDHPSVTKTGRRGRHTRGAAQRPQELTQLVAGRAPFTRAPRRAARVRRGRE